MMGRAMQITFKAVLRPPWGADRERGGAGVGRLQPKRTSAADVRAATDSGRAAGDLPQGQGPVFPSSWFPGPVGS